jgi:hypothetical protein
MSQEITEDPHMMTTSTLSDHVLMRASGSRKIFPNIGGSLHPEIIRDRSNGARSARPRDNVKSPMGNSMTSSLIGYDQDHTMKAESVR